MRKDFRKIYEALAQMGLRIVIYSNGSMITPETARWLKEAPPAMVSITMYGANSDTYQRITGSEAGFNNTLRGLDALKSEGIPIGIKMTAVKGNYKEFEQINEIAKKYSAGLGIVSYISPRREGENTDPVGSRLSPQEVIEFDRMALEQNHEMGNEKNSVIIEEDNMAELPQEDLTKTTDISSVFRCYAGKAGFWMTWDGKLTPCGLMNTPEERPLEIGFYNAWEALKEKCRRIPHCKDCDTCSIRYYCRTCPARRMSETGEPDKPADYLCEMAKYNSLQLDTKQIR